MAKKLIGAPAAPSAPSAPAVRNSQGLSSSAASSAGNVSTDLSAAPGANNVVGNPNNQASGGDTSGTGTPGVPPKQNPAPNSVPSPLGAINDPQYWNNVMALNSQYGTEMASSLANQQLADNDYRTEGKRMKTDRERGRRNLAESMLGRGNIYGGMHRRDQVEGDQDYLNNASRLGSDYNIQNEARLAERNDIGSRLKPGTGTDWVNEGVAYQERESARLIDQAQYGEGDYTRSKGMKVKDMTGKLKKMRGKAEKIEDTDKRKKYRQKIHKLRRKRDNLRGK